MAVKKIRVSKNEREMQVTTLKIDKEVLQKFDEKCEAAKTDRTKAIVSLMTAVNNGEIVLE